MEFPEAVVRELAELAPAAGVAEQVPLASAAACGMREAVPAEEGDSVPAAALAQEQGVAGAADLEAEEEVAAPAQVAGLAQAAQVELVEAAVRAAADQVPVEAAGAVSVGVLLRVVPGDLAPLAVQAAEVRVLEEGEELGSVAEPAQASVPARGAAREAVGARARRVKAEALEGQDPEALVEVAGLEVQALAPLRAESAEEVPEPSPASG